MMPSHCRRRSNELSTSDKLDQLRELQHQLGSIIQDAKGTSLGVDSNECSDCELGSTIHSTKSSPSLFGTGDSWNLGDGADIESGMSNRPYYAACEPRQKSPLLHTKTLPTSDRAWGADDEDRKESTAETRAIKKSQRDKRMSRSIEAPRLPGYEYEDEIERFFEADKSTVSTKNDEEGEPIPSSEEAKEAHLISGLKSIEIEKVRAQEKEKQQQIDDKSDAKIKRRKGGSSLKL